MRTAARMFAVAGGMLLIFGLVVAKVAPPEGTLTIPMRGSRAFDMSFQAPCYMGAALFAAFGCLYGFSRLRFGDALARWHFWSSAAAVALYVMGMVLLCVGGNAFVRGPHIQPPMAVLVATALGLFVGPPVFLAGQILFIINLTKATGRHLQTDSSLRS